MPTEVTTIQKAVDIGFTETEKVKPLKESRIESYIIGDEPRERNPIERLAVKPPTPPRSPSSLRRLTSRTPPAITVDDPPNSEKAVSEQSGGDTPTSSLSCESSPRLKRRDSLTLIRSATPEELASGARRKIFIPREGEGVGVVVALGVGGSPLDTQVKKEAPYMSPSQARRAAFLQAPAGSQTPPLERRSPLLSRRKATLEVPKVVKEISTEEPESPKTEVKPPEKEKQNPFKAPQVIRKIRGEPFPDASGHLKLWCQFFNVLSDSTIKWYRDEEEIVEVKRSGGDESQVALAIVQTSSRDCGVYGCSIKNEFGTDSTDFLLSVDLLSEYFLREDLEVGEEMEMTPMLFTKGLADPGYWGEKFFGRIMTQEAHLGEGCAHKACRAKVIYGLDPVFESGTTCIIKLQSPIAYGTKQESNLAERNMEITKQECKIQNTVREYCKIFAAEARVIENFGFSLEVSPLYLVYRPANSVPYATVEADLKGIFLKYCMMDAKGRLITRATSEVEMKCCSFQHWIHQWTNSNLLVTGLEGVGPKITKVRIVTKSKGYQGLTEDGSPKVFEQFLTQHQCNYYCGLLSLRTLKPMNTLQQPPKIKGSRSPLLVRKLGSSSPQLNRKLGSSSPQLQRKGLNSPLTTRKATSSPKVPRKTRETEDNQSTAKPKAEESLKVVV
ncbi:alpha-protein kinase 3-like [Salvelinus namaycush]|uniref:non-specific serine/threonine protein kinase n=1 Tax=Salvelinus namaycush TaxID=8040 RepID=A0A8U1H918_SALNM|nr:alpha-protein kinase 3-like [Salvelinus namaycush]